MIYEHAPVIQGDSLNELVLQAANQLKLSGAEVKRRGSAMLEARTPVLFQLHNPGRNLCTLAERELNPWVALAEFPWLLAGRNDLAWLRPYLPRAVDFSDDGLTWRAGYGPRLREWNGADQLQFVIQELKENPESRRAVISLWDPETDTKPGSRDYPCSNWLHFQLRDGLLELSVTMRSNDLIWGFSGVNVTNFCFLQRYVASQIGRPVGQYFHLASNLHVYPRHFDMLTALVKRANDWDWTEHALGRPYFMLPEVEPGRAMDAVEKHRSLILPPVPLPPTGIIPNFFELWEYFMKLHCFREHVLTAEQWRELLDPLPTDWALATARLLLRRGNETLLELVKEYEDS